MFDKFPIENTPGDAQAICLSIASLAASRTDRDAGYALTAADRLCGSQGTLILCNLPENGEYVWRVAASSHSLRAVSRRTRQSRLRLRELLPNGERVALSRAKGGFAEEFVSTGEEDLCTELRRRGLKSAMSVRVQRSDSPHDIFVLGCNDENQVTSSEHPDLQRNILKLIAYSACRAPLYRSTDRSSKLTRTEREVLQMIANGWSPTEVAEIREKSIKTIRNQLERARRRLNANTLANAVAIAIRVGLIEPSDS